MRNLQISCLFIFLISSCGLTTMRGYMERSPTIDVITNDYFSNAKKDYVYKANFDVFMHNFGGVLIIKKINNEQHRFVFTTEFGKKIFDFELINDDFKVNYILDDLNKKVIVNTLQKDLQLLVKQRGNVFKEFEKDNEVAYQTLLNGQFNFYFFSKGNKHLTKIISTSKHKEKVTINFNRVENNIAENIEIIHQNIKMKIRLNYMGD